MKKSLVAIIIVCCIVFVGMIATGTAFAYSAIYSISKSEHQAAQEMTNNFNNTVSAMFQNAQEQSDNARAIYGDDQNTPAPAAPDGSASSNQSSSSSNLFNH